MELVFNNCLPRQNDEGRVWISVGDGSFTHDTYTIKYVPDLIFIFIFHFLFISFFSFTCIKYNSIHQKNFYLNRISSTRRRLAIGYRLLTLRNVYYAISLLSYDSNLFRESRIEFSRKSREIYTWRSRNLVRFPRKSRQPFKFHTTLLYLLSN